MALTQSLSKYDQGFAKVRSRVVLAPGFNSVKDVIDRRRTKIAENISHPKHSKVVTRLEPDDVL